MNGLNPLYSRLRSNNWTTLQNISPSWCSTAGGGTRLVHTEHHCLASTCRFCQFTFHRNGCCTTCDAARTNRPSVFSDQAQVLGMEESNSATTVLVYSTLVLRLAGLQPTSERPGTTLSVEKLYYDLIAICNCPETPIALVFATSLPQ